MAIKANKHTTLTADLTTGDTTATLSSAVFDNGTAVPLVVDYNVPASLEVITADITGPDLTNIAREKDGTALVAHTGTPKIALASTPEAWSYYLKNDFAEIADYADIEVTDLTNTSDADITGSSMTFTAPSAGVVWVGFSGYLGGQLDANGRLQATIKLNVAGVSAHNYFGQVYFDAAVANGLVHFPMGAMVPVNISAGSTVVKLRGMKNPYGTNYDLVGRLSYRFQPTQI